MSFVRYHHSHSRERNNDDDPFYTARPLVRRNSKRQRLDIYDDDEYDDYPYSSSHRPAKPSRALTIRNQPSQLEKYNVWSSPSTSHDYSPRRRADDDEDDDDYAGSRYKYTVKRYTTRPSHSDDEDEREREFRLKVKATFGRPKSSHSSSHRATAWSGDLFRRREKWEDEDYESRDRERGDAFWDEERERERTVRYRRIKRTKTEEWKPLSGWRRV
ncbi:hypothetical protein BU26DRAFT_140762 [Trematosphaeria pertusa]|uniref:Uncharacterized protein n=1 Tax=Trematosphaeria pertusa TaxID=390896 RepID=A0A6A6IVJ0_9PLEO|nr:uncharacterized protein BU26DRAFT_140762 [Trematosphaeria pertusa]KAF2254571.1 hypothetical protein BU26DRAFT_140762 [Trematosphaeria pertusa]